MLDEKTNEAIFKYGIVHELICGIVSEKTKFIEELCRKEFTFHGGVLFLYVFKSL